MGITRPQELRVPEAVQLPSIRSWDTGFFYQLRRLERESTFTQLTILVQAVYKNEPRPFSKSLVAFLVCFWDAHTFILMFEALCFGFSTFVASKLEN